MNEENSVIVIDQQEQHKKKGALAVILAIAFVAILGIGGTFAYLTYTTNQAMNKLSVQPAALTADLIEPAWTNVVLRGDSGAKGKANDGSTVIPIAAQLMSPGATVAKNPFVVNTSKIGDGKVQASSGYVAMKLTFEKWKPTDVTTSQTDGSYQAVSTDDITALLNCYALQGATNTTTSAGINPNTGWTEFKASEVIIDASAGTYGTDSPGVYYFVYDKALQAMYSDGSGTETVPVVDETSAANLASQTWGHDTTYASALEASAPLFDTITLRNATTNAQLDEMIQRLQGGTGTYTVGTDLADVNKNIIPGWRVTAKACIVQTVTGMTANDFKKEYLTLLDATAATSATGWRTDKGNGLPAAA